MASPRPFELLLMELCHNQVRPPSMVGDGVSNSHCRLGNLSAQVTGNIVNHHPVAYSIQ